MGIPSRHVPHKAGPHSLSREFGELTGFGIVARKHHLDEHPRRSIAAKLNDDAGETNKKTGKSVEDAEDIERKS